jgi:hypothetical protein
MFSLSFLPYFVIVSVKVKKVMDISRLKIQLVAVAAEAPALLAQRG